MSPYFFFDDLFIDMTKLMALYKSPETVDWTVYVEGSGEFYISEKAGQALFEAIKKIAALDTQP